MATFNPEQFLQTEQSEKLESKYTPIPEEDYRAIIDEVDSQLVGKEKDRPVLYVTYSILDEDLKEKLNLQKVTVRQTIWLDVNESGALVVGTNSNVKLGKLLEALDLNGKPWSPKAIVGGGPVLIHVGQRKDENDPEVVYNDVKRVAKIA